MAAYLIVPLIAVVTMGQAPGLRLARHSDECRPLAGFHQAVQEYVILHRTLEAGLPAPEVSADPERFQGPIKALRGAVQTARANAQQGDVFTKEGGTLVRLRIQTTLARNGYDAAELVREMMADAEIESPALRVNDRFPWLAANAMWPLIIAALPPLPEELEYRFVGRDLVLLDVHAGLIVDILPNAL